MTTASPMMVQYLALKAEACDSLLFYRMGDFYEMFFDDAQRAAQILDIALTSRGEHEGRPVPMCGVPVHAADAYLARLIRAGEQVAVADQVETPAEAKARGGSKALVARAIIRYVTAGTLTEEALLEPHRANTLAAICMVRDSVGIAACDISTGQMELEECAPAEMESALARIRASELIAPDNWDETVVCAPVSALSRPSGDFSSKTGSARLTQIHNVATLDGFGQFTRPMLAAAGGLIAYLEHTGQGALPLLLPPQAHLAGSSLAMDESTRSSLEILASSTGGREGSLIAIMDRTMTGAGARLLAQDLSAPLTNHSAILARLELVSWLHDDALLREDIRTILRRLPDLGRALGRVVAGRGSPRDLGQIRDGLARSGDLVRLLAGRADLPALLQAILPALSGHGSLIDLYTRALIETPPTERAQGGFIAEGFDASLDALRKTAGNARRAIAALEAKYREETGIQSLKIRHNNVLGYFIEVPAQRADPLMAQDSGFTHRQTMASAVRFNAVALHEEAQAIAEAGGHALACEEEHFAVLVNEAIAHSKAIGDTAAALARLDVAQSHAERGAEAHWTLPRIVEEPCLAIKGGRHPVVEAALLTEGKRFIANDCTLSPEDRLWLIGGPNMGGKSTFLRQNALIVLMAQAGSLVPASEATIGLVDRLFSRVGASDMLAKGRSTFMVEMVETAAILSQATERSMVILDEVGRGTSTYDGLALAWAIAEAICENNRSRCLFATHYHELARLEKTCSALSLHHVRAREWKGELVLLHELANGPADQSYGIAVAKLAGISPAVLARARTILAKLEKGRAATGGLAAGLDDLPLFSAAWQEDSAPKVDPLREQLRTLDLDSLSPRAALDVLYALQRDAGET